jgi:RNA polymerase primary sigma factor
MVEIMSRVRREQRRLTQELGREATMDELAETCDLSPSRVEELLKIAQDPLSLDTPVGAEDDTSLADFVEDSQAIRPADAATRKMLGDEVSKVLGLLTPREQEVVRLRFGLDDGRPRTLEEVGRTFGVTRERIRQIESKTLAKLRHPQRSEHLKSYLVD